MFIIIVIKNVFINFSVLYYNNSVLNLTSFALFTEKKEETELEAEVEEGSKIVYT